MFLFLINILISVISFDVGFLQLFDHTFFPSEIAFGGLLRETK